MRVLTPILYAAVFGVAVYLAVSQSQLPQAAASAPTDNLTTPLAYETQSTGSTPVRIGKRETCRQAVTSKKLRRGEARDQMQVCVAQAKVECLQQAIDQKIRGPARRVYVKSCVAS